MKRIIHVTKILIITVFILGWVIFASRLSVTIAGEQRTVDNCNDCLPEERCQHDPGTPKNTNLSKYSCLITRWENVENSFT